MSLPWWLARAGAARVRSRDGARHARTNPPTTAHCGSAAWDERAQRAECAAGAGGKGKAADAAGTGGTGKGGGSGGGKKGRGGSKGAGLRENKAAKVVPGKLYYPGADVPKGESVSEFGFRVVSGYNPTATYRAGAQISLTIEFTRGGSTYRPTFSVKVVSHTKQPDKIVFEAVNATRWGITGTPYEMAADAPLTLTSSVTAKPAAKKR